MALHVDRRGLEVTRALRFFDLCAAATRARTRALGASFEFARTRTRTRARTGAGAFRLRVALAFAVTSTRCATRIFAVALAVALTAAAALEASVAASRASSAAGTRALRARFDRALAFAFGFALAADFATRAARFEFARFNRRSAFIQALRHAINIGVTLGRIEFDGELRFRLRGEHRLELRCNRVANLLGTFATANFGLRLCFGHSEISAESAARSDEILLEVDDGLVHIVRDVEEGLHLALNLGISFDVQRSEVA